MGRITTSGEVFSSSGAVAISHCALGQLLVHAAGKFQVFPCLALVRRRAQQISGMIRHHQRGVQLTKTMHLPPQPAELQDRKSTRLNSSHSQISYAVFCLKKKKTTYSTVFPRL